MAHFEQYPLSYQPQHYRYDDIEIKEEQLAQSLLNYTFDTMYSTTQSDVKYDAFRSISQNSFRQIHSDQAPSLHSPASGPSLHSASSSTVGSPSSTHAMPVPQTMYPHEYILGPAIVDDSYPYAYESGHFDHESAFRQTKFGVPCVGKSTDFSFLIHRPATSSSFVYSPFPTSEFIPAQTSPPQKRASEGNVVSGPLPGVPSVQREHVFKCPTTPASAYLRSSSQSNLCYTASASALFLSRFSFFPSHGSASSSSGHAYQVFFSQANGNFPHHLGFAYFLSFLVDSCSLKTKIPTQHANKIVNRSRTRLRLEITVHTSHLRLILSSPATTLLTSTVTSSLDAKLPLVQQPSDSRELPQTTCCYETAVHQLAEVEWFTTISTLPR